MLTVAPPLEWYQQGYWPLVGAIAVIAVTNAVTLVAIYLKAGSEFKTQLRLKSADFVANQLAEFYDPILTLLQTNRSIFDELGPSTFPTLHDKIRRDAAAEQWNMMKEKIIAPNNKKIADILTHKTHLIDSQDSLTKYLSLFTHLAMYEAFREQPNEIYKKFQFPTGIEDHVQKVRNTLIKRLKANELR